MPKNKAFAEQARKRFEKKPPKTYTGKKLLKKRDLPASKRGVSHYTKGPGRPD